MTKKIFKGIFFSCLATMLACLVLIIGVLYDHFDLRLKEDLKGKTELVAASMNTMGEAYLNSLNTTAERITHIAADGTVLYDTEMDVATAENHGARAEFVQAIETGRGESVRDSGTAGKKRLYYAIRLDDGTVIRLSMTQNTVWMLVLGILPTIAFIVIAFILLSFGLASALSRHIVRPINEIDPDHPEQYEGYEELTPFIRKIKAQKRRLAREKNELSKSREQFRLITENMSEGLLIIDPNINILSCNRAAVRLLSGGTEVQPGQSALVLSRAREFVQAVKEGLQGKNTEHQLHIGERIYQLIASPVVTGQEITGVVMVILDITEQKQREQLRHEFTSNVSHELKTPLTSIYGISDMLSGGMVRAEDVSSFADDIRREADRLIHLVEDILRLSRLDEGAFSNEMIEVDLLEIAHTTQKSLQAAAKKAEVALQVTGEAACVTGHPTILEEMIFNLCDNAIKYNRPGGRVHLSISQTKEAAVIQVEDTGIGIPAGEQERVFERFYRVDKSHSRAVGGTGLGLSIVKHGVAYHSGKVTLESREGEGTTVTVTLPNNK